MRIHRTLLGGLAVVAVAGLLFFYQLGEKDIWERTEGRTTVIARNMVESSEYIVPELFGRPFIDNRPPGYYWLAALAYKLTGGTSEFLARVPAALAAVACVLVIYLFGCQVAGIGAGVWGSIVLLGIVKFAWQARLAEQDILLALWTCLGFWAFWHWIDPNKARGRSIPARLGWAALLHVLVGLGVMTKGPGIGITFVLPALGYVLVSRRWRDVDWTILLVSSPLCVALSLWWYVYVWFALPAERGQLLGRFLNQSDLHVRGWYYYLLKMPALLGPATLLVPLLWWKWRDASREERSGRLGFALAWFLGTLLIFSLFSSKQTHYLVPAIPGLAFALGTVLASPPPHHGRQASIWFVRLIMATLLLAPIGWVFFAPQKIGVFSRPVEYSILAVCCAEVLLLGFSLCAGRVEFAFRAAWCFWLLGMGVVLGEVVPHFDAIQSPRAFADRVDASLPVGSHLGLLTNHPGVASYLDEPVLLFEDGVAARAFLEMSDLNYVLVESDDLSDEFQNFEITGTVVVLKQDGFMKRNVTAYLLRDPH